MKNVNNNNLLHCEYCGSSTIKKLKSESVPEDTGHITYEGNYVCLKCGANCEEKQVWTKTESPDITSHNQIKEGHTTIKNMS